MRLLGLILAGLLLLMLSVVILAFTPAGLHGGVWLAKQVLPGELSIDGMQGRPARQFAFEQLEYHDGELALVLEDLELSWQPLSLARGRLEVLSLSAADIEITAPPGSKDAAGAPDIHLPLALRVHELRIDSLQFNQAGTPPLSVQNLHAAAYTTGSGLIIERFSLAGRSGGHEFRIAADGHLQLVSPWQHDLQTRFEFKLPQQPVITGRAASSGSLDQLTVTATTSDPFSTELNATARQLAQTPDWQGTLKTRDADISPWLDTDAATLLTATLDASGSGQGISAALDMELSGAMATRLNADTRLQLEPGQTITIRSLILNSPDQGLELQLGGSVDYSTAPVVNLGGDWTLEQPGRLHGTLKLAGMPDDYQLDLTAATATPIDSNWQLESRGNSQALEITRLHGRFTEGEVNAAGRLDWQDTFAVNLEGQWQNILLPVAGQTLQSPAGHFTLQGSPETYALTTTGKLAGPDIPAIDWQLEASGDQTQISFGKLQLSLLEGQIIASGRADWQSEPLLDTDIHLQSINPGSYWQDWPGQLHGRAQVSLRRQQDNWLAGIHDLTIDGRLRGYPVKATGAIQTDTHQYDINDVRLTIADSHLQANGRLSRDSELQWQFNSPDLGQLWPDAEGQVEASGRLLGDYDHPELIATLSATAVDTPWLQLARINADIDVQTPRDRFNVDISADDLTVGQQNIDSLEVLASGSFARHTLETTLSFDDRSLSLAGTGQWKKAGWSVEFDQGDYRGAATGDWQLDSSLQLDITENSIESPEHCWQQQSSRLCLASGWQRAGPWHGELSLNHYSITRATRDADGSVMPLSGELAMNLQLRGNNTELQHAEGEVRLQELALQADTETQLQVSKLNVDLSGDSSGINLDINGEFTEPAPGTLSGRLRTGRFDLEQPAAASIDGQLKADIQELQPWLALYPRFTADQAQLTMDFAVTGRVGSPALDGEMQLTATNAGIPDLGINMESFELRVTGQPQSGLQLAGQASSGPGGLTIDGRVDVRDGALVLPAMTIKGERFELLNLPEAWVLISPDLGLQYSDNLLEVNGRISVPEALLQPFGAPGTIAVSDDEYIVTEEKRKTTPALETRADIKLELGDKVRVTGRGFESRLEGNLDIRQEPGKPASATGELQVVDGSYSAYGQQLNVRSGEIIFTNQPIDNPAIRAEAVRSVGDVTAGIRATGTAQQPVTELFSTPAMPEADILSYLVIGRPLNSATSGEGDILMQAATSMGIKRTEGLRQTIASTLGIDTLAVDTSTGAEGESETRLVIGKYLSPNLYLSYGAGLVDSAVDTVKLRYEINRHLSLEAEQGAGTGVDLLYQIESGGWWGE